METKIDVGEVKTLREQIATGIRSSIIDGRIGPGEKLTEEEIAHQLRVSRTPVREAFFQLVSEGFVDVEPRRGVVVREISLRDAEETYEVKGVLEGLAARLAVEHCTSDLIRTLEEINDALYLAADEQSADVKEILDLNNKFHLAISDACNNKKVIQQIVSLRRQTLRYNYVFLSALSRLRQSADEHQAIINALAHRDADEVERLLRLHNEAALASLRTFMLNKNSQ
ncbi:MAG: GntR family transcriptional regulator [Bacteroidota bacterium]